MGIKAYLFKDFGRDNKVLRDNWIKDRLLALPKKTKLLDAGAGEMPYKVFCNHLDYVSQDFCKYDGIGNATGLQTTTFDTSKIDIVSDLTNIPVNDSELDAVLCSEVLEHVPNPIAVFDEIDRVLKPRGVLLLTASFNSVTHFVPYHFSAGFTKNFYEYLLKDNYTIFDDKAVAISLI